ncbi:hypothetical protein EVAR_66899_1 [Eumeta japonica]|uniref:Uncharacterized protein n=1 Tax=Eumeta variegata TaxID=151549 RepID=A0A4C2ACT8_EUMVA|nr:hypothetical protein EVAR_66899_1 [Eumeta japonica]
MVKAEITRESAERRTSMELHYKQCDLTGRGLLAADDLFRATNRPAVRPQSHLKGLLIRLRQWAGCRSCFTARPARRPAAPPRRSSRAVVYLRDVAANTIKGITFLLFSYISMPRSSTSRTKRETCPQRRAGGRRAAALRDPEQTRGAGATFAHVPWRASPAGGKYYTVNEKFTHVSAPNAPVRPATPPVTLLDVGEDGVGDSEFVLSLNKQILPQPGA